MSALTEKPFAKYDIVRHKDGRQGLVTVTTPSAKGQLVSVNFPNHHRISVILAKNLTLIGGPRMLTENA